MTEFREKIWDIMSYFWLFLWEVVVAAGFRLWKFHGRNSCYNESLTAGFKWTKVWIVWRRDATGWLKMYLTSFWTLLKPIWARFACSWTVIHIALVYLYIKLWYYIEFCQHMYVLFIYNTSNFVAQKNVIEFKMRYKSR